MDLKKEIKEEGMKGGKIKNKKMLKSTNGITLIALVVTIIVLLILAGVSINMVLGKHGIFEKAKETQKIQALAEEKEKLENARLAAMIDGLGEVTVDGYTGKWKVLGAGTGEKAGKLLIMTTSNVTTCEFLEPNPELYKKVR